MKKILVASMVLGMCAVAAQAGISYSVDGNVAFDLTKVGTYVVNYLDPEDPGEDIATVDVYDLTIYTNPSTLPDGCIAVVTLTFGSDTGSGDDPYQSGWVLRTGKSPNYSYPTDVTPYEYKLWEAPTFWEGDGTNLYEADSRFWEPNDGDPYPIEEWTYPPGSAGIDETNDASLYDPGNDRDEPRAGVGDLWIDRGLVPNELDTAGYQILIARIGVVQGTTVYGKSVCGYVTDVNDPEYGSDPGTVFLIPEPAALTVLGLGALTLIRRRRT